MFNKEIATSLNISERTVKNHISNIFKKIDFKDKISQRLLKSQIKKYRIIGFCLKYNLMELYESIYSLYRKIFWNDFL